MTDWQIHLAPIEIGVPIIIKKGEAVLRLGRAEHFKSKTRTVRSGGSYSGVSVRVAKGVRFSTGAILQDLQRLLKKLSKMMRERSY